MSLLRLAYIIALRRTISNWKLETALFVGIVLAVALMSSGVVFSGLLEEAALRRALDDATPEEANLSVGVFNDLDDPSSVSRRSSVYQAGLDFVDRRVYERFEPYLEDHAHLFQTSTFFFEGFPRLELDNTIRPRGKIQYMTGLVPDSYGSKTRVEVLRGHWPYTTQSANTAAPNAPLEVAIDDLGAQWLELDVGDEMDVFPAAGEADPVPMTVKIVGVFRRTDPTDEYWYKSGRVFSFQNEVWTTVPMFTSEDAILGRVGMAYPGLYTNIVWFFYLDRHGLRAGDVNAVQDTIRRVEFDVLSNLARSDTSFKLDTVLDDYEEQILLARIPLFLMVFLVTAILIYYLALVTGLIVKSRATEISMLKSRGATTVQIGLLALVEGLLLTVPAVFLGPLLALGVSKVLGQVFFNVGTGVESVPIVLSFQAFLLGLGGAFLAIAVLTISTLLAGRQGIVEFRQSGARPSRVPIIHRYYLDVLLLVLIGLVWWQIQSRGSFLVRSLGTGELEIDYSLLLGPVLLLLALGLLVLRVFPWVVAILARVSEGLGPAWLMQGLRRVSRDPIVPGTLVVLLMVATALGVIGSAFSSTLERSQRDRALYAAGSDLRIEHNGDGPSVPLLGLSDLAEEVAGIDTAVEAQRTGGSLLNAGFTTASISILAVDTEDFENVAWHRPDFANGKSLGELMRDIAPAPSPTTVSNVGTREVAGSYGEGIVLPQDTRALSLWVRPGRPDFNSRLLARLQDARGFYFDISIGELGFNGWRHFEADITPLPPPGRRFRGGRLIPLPEVTPPFTLLALQVAARGTGFTEPGVLFWGGVSAVTSTGESVLSDFQTLDGWHVIEDYAKPGLYAWESSESVALDDAGRSAAFSWAPGSFALRGIRAGGPEMPIPAVVSEEVLDIAEVEEGDILNISISSTTLPIRIVAVTDYFPTLDPRREPFVVLDLRTFTHYSNMHDQRLVGGSNELWASLDDSLSPGEFGRVSTGVIDAISSRGMRVEESSLASEMVAQRVQQPLVSAGWSGLLVLMFLTLVLASASGVMLFSYTDLRERQTEFALLRTLGFSKGQLNGVVWFNLALVVVCGIALGTWVGQMIGNSLLPVMEVAEGGVRVTPPMVFERDWVALLVSYLILGGVTIGTIAWLVWLTAKLEVQQVLRIGE